VKSEVRKATVKDKNKDGPLIAFCSPSVPSLADLSEEETFKLVSVLACAMAQQWDTCWLKLLPCTKEAPQVKHSSLRVGIPCASPVQSILQIVAILRNMSCNRITTRCNRASMENRLYAIAVKLYLQTGQL